MLGKRSRTGQGGSIVPFVVVGIVLIGLVVGGLYILQHRDTAGDSGSPTVGTSSSPSPQPDSTSPAPSSSPQPSSSPSQSPSVAQNGQDSSQIPKTGPSDMMPAGIVLAIVVGVATSFIQSHITKRRSAH